MPDKCLKNGNCLNYWYHHHQYYKRRKKKERENVPTVFSLFQEELQRFDLSTLFAILVAATDRGQGGTKPLLIFSCSI